MAGEQAELVEQGDLLVCEVGAFSSSTSRQEVLDSQDDQYRLVTYTRRRNVPGQLDGEALTLVSLLRAPEADSHPQALMCAHRTR